MNQDPSTLHELILQIVDPQHPLWSLGPETNALYEFLLERAEFQIDPNQDISAGETRSERGLAISPTQAAMCAWEVARTAAFIRGTVEAVRDEIDRLKPTGRPVHILYAGCGPLALLAVPVMALFPADQVQFVLLDIHLQSITSARGIVDSLGFGKHVLNYVHGDACLHDLSSGPEPDLIVSETMNVCLANEPLVAIACHLLKQSPSATLIPQRVYVEACLLDESREFEFVASDPSGDHPVPDRDRVLLGTVFELNGDSARRWAGTSTTTLPAAVIELPPTIDARYRPMLLTRVDVYGEIRLRDYDCSLTIPQPIPAGQELCGGETLEFDYRLGSEPGLVVQRVRRK